MVGSNELGRNHSPDAGLPTVRSVAIVGFGSMGRRHLRLLKDLRREIDVTLVRSGKGPAWPEEALAWSKVSTLEEVIRAGVDAAIVSSPAPHHVSQAIQLIRAGIPLLIEKPLSHSLEAVDQLERIASDHSAIVLVGYVLRHSAAGQRFKEMIESGLLGTLLHARIECGSYLPDWRPDQDYRETVSARPELGGGVLLELSHELDYVQWFFGPVKKVRAVLANSNTLELQVEDTVNLILTMGSDMLVSVHLDFCRRHTVRSCTVQGTGGGLAWDVIRNQVIWTPVNGKKKVWQRTAPQDHLYMSQLSHFLACIEQGTKPAVTLKDGIGVLRVVEAARYASIAERTVTL